MNWLQQVSMVDYVLICLPINIYSNNYSIANCVRLFYRAIFVRLLSDWLSNETEMACVSDVCTCLMGVWFVEG